MAQLDILKQRNRELDLRLEQQTIDSAKIQMRLSADLEECTLALEQCRSQV